MRAVIYCRVSTEEQAEEGPSIEAQQRLARQFCRHKGWKMVGEYVDKGWSARTMKRPQLQDMLAEAHAGRFDVIVVHKLDRLSRSLSDMLKLVGELAHIKVTFASVSEDFDFTSSIGKVLLALLGAFAQYFIDNLQEETKKGKRERALKGLYNGSLSFGYQRVAREAGGVPVFHPKNIKGYRMAIRLGARGFSIRRIAKAMNAAGYRTTGNWGNRPFSGDTVLPMLKSRFYLGLVYYKGQWLPGKHPAAIDRETRDKYQSQLKGRAWKRKGQPCHSTVYPLRRLLHCASCERVLRGTRSKDGRRYRNPAKDYGECCSQRETIKAEILEQQILDLFAFIGSLPCWKNKIKRLAVARSRNPHDEGASRSIQQLERIKHLYILGDMTQAEYHAERQRVQVELDNGIHSSPYHLERIVPLLADFHARWEEASSLERNAMLQAMIEKGWVEGGRIVAIELQPAIHGILAPATAEVRARQGIILLPPGSDFKSRKRKT
jgi:DNA invertase Pin-like site-specific DNA recombinase